MNIDKIKGRVFTSPSTSVQYGTIRKRYTKSYPEGFPIEFWVPFADDDCGNIFAISANGNIGFWDHETDEIMHLSDSFEKFCGHCFEPEDVELDPKNIVSIWVNPDFKPEFD